MIRTELSGSRPLRPRIAAEEHKMSFWLLRALIKSPTDTITDGSSIPQVRRSFFDQASVDEIEAFEI